MTAPRKGRIWRLHRLVTGSPHTHRGLACRDSAPCSRRSCADGASLLLRRMKRTSKPPRKLLFRICRKARRRAFFRRVSSLPPAAIPGRVRRRRRLRRARVRSAGTSRPRGARAFASPPSRAPCAGGSRDFGRRMRLPLLGLRRIGRVGPPGPFRGRIRRGCARAREIRGRISDKGPSPCARPSAACGVRAHKRALSPGPCVAWDFPHVLNMPCRRQRDGETSGGRKSCPGELPHRVSIRAHTRCSPQS